MTIKEELATELRDAIKSQDALRRDAIRQVETEVRNVTSQPGVGEATDDVYEVVIAAYVKKMAKARDEYRELGERGEAMADKLAFEVDYLSRWLPDKLGVAETTKLVRQTIEDMRVWDDPKAVGRVVGALMKTRDDLDGALVNRLARQELEG
ncbi:MAG: GatB/YqeY domain-containing protein [Acidimicrobiia bacterium]